MVVVSSWSYGTLVLVLCCVWSMFSSIFPLSFFVWFLMNNSFVWFFLCYLLLFGVDVQMLFFFKRFLFIFLFLLFFLGPIRDWGESWGHLGWAWYMLISNWYFNFFAFFLIQIFITSIIWYAALNQYLLLGKVALVWIF